MSLIRRAGTCGLLLGLPAFTQGIITTVVGTDWFFPGNGRPAIAAPLGRVQHVTVGRDGILYIADPDNSLVFKVGATGILSIVAGNGTARFSGDNGPAALASLNQPSGVTADAAGNVYIADTINNRIRQVSTSGVISTVAGTGDYAFNGDNIPATLAALAGPTDVAVDSTGNIFIADLGNNRVRKVSASTGFISTIAGTGSAGFSGDGGPATSAMVTQPVGLSVDTKDQIYIADNRRILRIGQDGAIHTVAGTLDYLPTMDGVPATKAAFTNPTAVAVDPSGIIYIADAGDSRIRKVGVNGIITTLAGTGVAGFIDGVNAVKANLNQPFGVAVDAQNNVFIGDTLNSRVRKVSPAGTITTIAGNGAYKFGGDGGPASAGLLNQPADVVIDHNGNIYISDTLNNRVRKINRAGVISTFAGDGFPRFSGDGGSATKASLNNPVGLALDAAGNLCIADSNNNRVRKVDGSGIISTAVGGGNQGEGSHATQAALQFPQFIAFDQAGNLYITEIQSFRVRKVNTVGIFTTLAGNGTPDYNGDGGPATKAAIGYSGGIAVDSSGNVYFAEIFNGRIRKVAPNGVISTYAGSSGTCCSGDGGPAINASLDATGLAVDPSGNLYIAGGHFVRKVATGGIVSTVAGGGSPPAGSIGDGGSALDATLNGATGIRVDSFGSVFIADSMDDRVRQVLNIPPPFDVLPATVAFSARSGGPPTVDQSILVTSSVTNLAYSVSAETSNGDWLIVSPDSGLVPGMIQAHADPINLPPGDYEGTVSIHAPNAVPSLRVVNVKLSVAPASAPTLAAEPDGFSFDFVAGLPGSSQDLLVRNNGSGVLSFTLAATTTTGGDWLSVTPSSGSVTVSAPAAVTVTADPGKLPPGTYAGLITERSGGASQQIFLPVTMTVHATTQTILLSQNGLTFSAVAGTNTVQMDSFQVLNPGLGTLNFTASSEVMSGATNWLSVSPPTGASGPGLTSPGEVDVSVDPANLPPGDYYGKIAIASPGAVNSPQVLSVILTIAPKGAATVPDIRPTGLIFVGFPDGQATPQQIVITNTGDSTNSFRSTPAAAAGPLFFSSQPTDGSLPPGQPIPISVKPNLQRLTPGVRRGSITLQFADGSTRVVAVLLVVPDQAAAQISDARNILTADTCTPSNLNLVFSVLGQGFQVPASFPTSIQLKVVDDCGTFLDSGSVVVSFSNGDPLLALIPVGGGRWSGTWQPGSSTSGIRVTATAQTPDRSLHGSLEITGTTTPNPSIPVITSGSVVNSASLSPRAPLSPGGIISIFGLNLSNGSAESGVPRDIVLNGTSAIVGGIALPLLYVSQNQVNAIVPYKLPINTNLQLLIQNRGTLTVPMPLPVAPAQPAVFTVNQSGSGQGYIFAANGHLTDRSNPVRAGDAIVIFCEGLGAVDQPLSAGVPAPFSPLARTSNPVSVAIGGIETQVAFAGLAPGFTGLYQVNAVVPSGVTPGDSVNLVLAVAGQISPPVTMATR